MKTFIVGNTHLKQVLLYSYKVCFYVEIRKILYGYPFLSVGFNAALTNFGIQGPVVQSDVSFTSSLRVISLTVLADSIYNILIFFAEKMWVAFAKLLTFFQQKFQHICVSLNVNFNESLTNDIVSFEQLGPDFYKCNVCHTLSYVIMKLCHAKEEYEKYHTFLPLMVRSINNQFNLHGLSSWR